MEFFLPLEQEIKCLRQELFTLLDECGGCRGAKGMVPEVEDFIGKRFALHLDQRIAEDRERNFGGFVKLFL